MDPKSLSKSKRSHTQKGRHNHQTPSTKKSTTTTTTQQTAKARDALPSNWARYNDQNVDDAEEVHISSSTAAADVAVKSKGADFSYLLDQARQNRNSQGFSFDASVYDDPSIDFIHGRVSTLSVRANALESWCADDNFIVDDDPTSNYEVPFLSMDLHALDAQLSKLKLSQRLFIEADLLPEELSVDDSKNTLVAEQSGISGISESVDISDSQPCPDFPLSEKNPRDQTATLNPNIFEDGEMTQEAVAEKNQPQTFWSHSTSIEPSNKSSIPLDLTDGSKVQEIILQTRNDATPISEDTKTSRFEAAAAEADLDLLLNSFSDTNISSAEDSVMNNNTCPKNSVSAFSAPMESISISKDSCSLRNAGATSLDDSIDDLLAETVPCLEYQKQRLEQQNKENKGAAFSKSLPLQPLGSRTGADCASSRHETTTSFIDVSIDDLLAETSVCLEDQKQNATCQQKEPLSSSLGLSSPNSNLGSKATDDFDAWLDTL